MAIAVVTVVWLSSLRVVVARLVHPICIRLVPRVQLLFQPYTARRRMHHRKRHPWLDQTDVSNHNPPAIGIAKDDWPPDLDGAIASGREFCETWFGLLAMFHRV